MLRRTGRSVGLCGAAVDRFSHTLPSGLRCRAVRPRSSSDLNARHHICNAAMQTWLSGPEQCSVHFRGDGGGRVERCEGPPPCCSSHSSGSTVAQHIPTMVQCQMPAPWNRKLLCDGILGLLAAAGGRQRRVGGRRWWFAPAWLGPPLAWMHLCMFCGHLCCFVGTCAVLWGRSEGNPIQQPPHTFPRHGVLDDWLSNS